MDEATFEQIKKTLVDGLNGELAEIRSDHPQKEISDARVSKGYIVAINTLAQSLRNSGDTHYQELGNQLLDFAQIYRSMTKG